MTDIRDQARKGLNDWFDKKHLDHMCHLNRVSNQLVIDLSEDSDLSQDVFQVFCREVVKEYDKEAQKDVFKGLGGW